MWRLGQGDRAVVVVGGGALLVAVVCFGLLNSAGTFENPGYSFGGAIGGFLAAGFFLYKVYFGAEASLIPPSEKRKASFVVVEAAKIVDLTRSAGRAPPHQVTVNDCYSVSKESEETCLVIRYATMGKEVTAGSLTHRSHKLEDVSDIAAHPREDNLNREYELHIDMSQLSRGQFSKVVNALTYTRRFQGLEKEWLHTYIDHPTGRLTVVLLFPEDRRCLSVTASVRTGRPRFEEIAGNQPVLIEDGRFVYWGIERPELGAAYQLEWEWAPPAPEIELGSAETLSLRAQTPSSHLSAHNRDA